jgi:hypothetical protein
MITTFLLILVYFMLGFIYSSFPEWLVHRNVMHRVFTIFGFKFTYPYKGHAQTHHRIFRGDESYHLANHEEADLRHDQKTIPMAWWNGIVLVAIASLPFLLWNFFKPTWFMVIPVVVSIACYYCTYEYIHWCMHKPLNRWFERTRLYKWIDQHHRLHHLHQGKNFNVVLPLADLLLGTLYVEKSIEKGAIKC